MPKGTTPAAGLALGRDMWQVVETSLNRIADALNRHQYAFLSLFFLYYFLTTCYRASRKLFWFDELFTVYISRLDGFGPLWSALKQGSDFNPPLLYGFTRLAELAFGEGHLASRLPEIVSFWIFCLCLFRFVSVKTSPLSGFVSMLFPLITTAYYYAYEARSHGLVLGFAGLALVCWQTAAARPERRFGWLLGLGGALSLAMLTHSFAILLLVPIVLGELARAARFRRVDWPVWLTVAAASAAVLVSLPLLTAVKRNVDPGFLPATPAMLVRSYTSHLAPAVNVLVGTLFLLCLIQVMPRKREPGSVSERTLDEHELVAILAFMTIPFFAFLAARLMGTPLLQRYSIASIAGFACLLGAGAARRPAIGVCVLLMVMAQAGIDFRRFVRNSFIIEPSSMTEVSTRMPEFKLQYDWMDAIGDKDLPIVLLDDLEFLPISYYAPPHLSPRLVYLVWPESRVIGEGYMRLQACCKTECRSVHLSDFLTSHEKFLAYSRSGYYAKRVDYFIRDGADVIVEKESPEHFLWSVSYARKRSSVAQRERR